MTDSGKKLIKFSIISAMVIIFFEVFIFNINFFHTFPNEYPICKLNLSDKNTQTYGGMIYLEWEDIDIPVGTIKIDAESDSMAAVDVVIDMSDDTNKEYRYNIAEGTVIKGNERSSIIICNFSGNVHKLRIRITAAANETITVNNIWLNRRVPFHFSIIRVLLIFSGTIVIYLLLCSEFMNREYNSSSRPVMILAYGITGLFGLAAFLLCCTGSPQYGITYSFFSRTGNQMTQELVDAFKNGQASLLYEPSEELLALDNPYDWSQRYVNTNIYYLWDHLLYNGKYYSYYGIAPVILLFLPYNLITGYYFPSAAAVLIFGVTGIIFLTKIYMWIIKKFFGMLQNNIVIMGLIMIQLITGVWFCFNVPNFYEIAQTSGFAAVTCGAYFLLSSNIICEGEISRKRVALGTIMLALAVLCRPTLAVYCVVSLILLAAGFKKLKKNRISYILCALLPYILIGSVQMVYNYIRFGSVLDFGIQYSLTINDFTKAQYHTHFVFISIYNYLFKWPGVSASYPFFGKSAFETFNVNGYYFIATNTAIGLLWKALPMLSYIYGIRLYRNSANTDKRKYLIIILAACIFAPLAVMFSIWESGYGARYSVDFAWQMLMGAFIIAFSLFCRCTEQTKKLLTRLMLTAAVISFILCFGQIYQWLGDVTPMTTDEYAAYLSFGRLFEFWK